MFGYEPGRTACFWYPLGYEPDRTACFWFPRRFARRKADPRDASRIAALEAENHAHRAAQAAVYLAIGEGNPDRNAWSDLIRHLRNELDETRAERDTAITALGEEARKRGLAEAECERLRRLMAERGGEMM